MKAERLASTRLGHRDGPSGHGLATEAATAMVAWRRSQNVPHVVADIHPGHLASQAVARYVGLHPTDVWVDGEQRWAD